MCRRTITTASCDHDLGWVLVQCQRIREQGAEHAHCEDLFVRSAQYIFLNGPCGPCVRQANGHEDPFEDNDDEEHGLGHDSESDGNDHASRSGDSDSDVTEEDVRTGRQEVGDLGQDMTRFNTPGSEQEHEENRDSEWDTYRYAPRGLSPVPEGSEPDEAIESTTSLATIRPGSSASHRQHSPSRIDLERRRLLRTVRARRRVRSEDIDDAPSINSYHASLRGGADNGEDFASDEDYRRVVDESNRAYQERMRTVVDDSRDLHQGQSEASEEEQIRQAMEASKQEHDAAQQAQMEADTQHLLAHTAQTQTATTSENDADLTRVLEQSAQEAKQAAETEESNILEQTLRLCLQERPTQSEDDYMNEVAQATAASAKEYTDRYGDYLSPKWKEQYDEFARKGFESSRAGGSDSGSTVRPPGHNEEETWVRRDVAYEREDSVAFPPGVIGNLASNAQGNSSQGGPARESSTSESSQATSSTASCSRAPSSRSPSATETGPATPCPPRPDPPAHASNSQDQESPAITSATDSTTAQPAARPTLNRAGPRGPQALGGSTGTPNLYRQHPDYAGAAARDAALRRHQTFARAPARALEREPKPREDAVTGEDFMNWWNNAANKS